jgi:molybdopterin-guanine dinucleotide biosynthesis protein B
MKRDSAPVIAISGVKNSGKTTLLEGLLAHLTARGLRVGVIKHDGHRFSPDVPGTDSYRHRAAGASGVAVFSAECYMIVKNQNVQIAELIEAFSDMDLILIEGMKSSRFPKVEVVRGNNSSIPVCDPSTILALATDLPLHLPGTPSYDINDYEGLAGFLNYYISDILPMGGADLDRPLQSCD